MLGKDSNHFVLGLVGLLSDDMMSLEEVSLVESFLELHVGWMVFGQKALFSLYSYPIANYYGDHVLLSIHMHLST